MNPKLNKRLLASWLQESIANLNNTSSIDVDAFYDKSIVDEMKTPRKIFNASCEVFDLVCSLINKYKDVNKNCASFLTIPLESISSSLMPCPDTTRKIVEQIDKYDMPELFIYSPAIDTGFPDNEFYRIPLNFKPYKFVNDVRIIYKQIRTFEEIKNNEPFTREISLFIS